MTSLYLTLPDSEAEAIIFAELRAYDEYERLRWGRIGLMALNVHRRLLWRYRLDPLDGLPCHSFARWLRIACPYAYSTVYASLRDVEALQDVPAEHLAEIPQANFATMRQLSTAVRADAAVLVSAKTDRPEDFARHIEQHHPLQHIEAPSSLRFRPTLTQKAIILRAIEEAIREGLGGTREEILEMWACEYLQGQGGASELQESMSKEVIQ